MIRIERLQPSADADSRSGLEALLADAVAGGASLGFLASLDEARNRTFWTACFDEAASGLRSIHTASAGSEVVGTVHLVPAQRENAAHRAEIQKLLVHSRHRGRGIGRRLMAAVQAEALRLGCWLLILDTDPGSPAERFYRRQGWHRAGEIPDYAAAPDGRLLPTVLFYKNLLGPEAA